MSVPEALARIPAQVPAAVVGLVFLWTAGIKAVAPHTFSKHLATLNLVPRHRLSSAVTAAAALEAAWGIVLIGGVFPSLSLPFSILVLVVLSGISVWGVTSGRVEDCGCYGGFIIPSIRQSLAINASLIGLVGLSMYLTRSGSGWAWPGVIAAAAGGIGFGALAEYAQRYDRKHGRPRFTPSPLVKNAPWNHAWANGKTRGLSGEVLISFLGVDCPFCQQWVRIANAMLEAPAMPAVLGVVSATAPEREKFIEDNSVRFPIANIPQSLMVRLAGAVPTTVLVEDGRIKDLWVGSPPPDFARRFIRAFFADPAETQAAASPPVVAAQNS